MIKLIFAFCSATTLFFCLSCTTKKSNNKTDGAFVDGTDNAISIDPNDPKKLTQIEWIDTLKDLGTLNESAGLIDISFRFKNIGKNPLSVNSVTAQCGCTSPEKPGKLIQPGETSEVKAKFKTQGQKGEVSKKVYVVTNTAPSFRELIFTAKMTEK